MRAQISTRDSYTIHLVNNRAKEMLEFSMELIKKENISQGVKEEPSTEVNVEMKWESCSEFNICQLNPHVSCTISLHYCRKVTILSSWIITVTDLIPGSASGEVFLLSSSVNDGFNRSIRSQGIVIFRLWEDLPPDPAQEHHLPHAQGHWVWSDVDALEWPRDLVDISNMSHHLLIPKEIPLTNTVTFNLVQQEGKVKYVGQAPGVNVSVQLHHRVQDDVLIPHQDDVGTANEHQRLGLSQDHTPHLVDDGEDHCSHGAGQSVPLNVQEFCEFRQVHLKLNIKLINFPEDADGVHQGQGNSHRDAHYP